MWSSAHVAQRRLRTILEVFSTCSDIGDLLLAFHGLPTKYIKGEALYLLFRSRKTATITGRPLPAHCGILWTENL